MIPCAVAYDPDTDEVVISMPMPDGQDAVLLRLKIREQPAAQRSRIVRRAEEFGT